MHRTKPEPNNERATLKIVTIELTAVWKDGYWAVLDKEGLVLGSIPKKVVHAHAKGITASRLECEQFLYFGNWMQWSRQQATRMRSLYAVAQRNSDRWNRRILSWQASLRNRKKPVVRDHEPSQWQTWDEAFERMEASLNSKARRAKEHANDRWAVWIESSVSSLSRRSREAIESKG